MTARPRVFPAHSLPSEPSQGHLGHPTSRPKGTKDLFDPKIFLALVCWIVYSFEAFAARRIGWGGRRAAYLSAVGFAIVLLNFVPISYFVTNSHDF